MSEIRVDNIRSQSGASSPSFPHGANVTGVVTATTFSGALPAAGLTGTIADARLGTVSSSKLSGALPSLDASNLTGVKAEPTIDIVASGSIGAGKAVVVTTDGKAGIVTGTNLGFGDKNDFATANSSWCDLAYDTTNNKVIIVYRDSGKGSARVGTVTGTSISWGTAVEFEDGEPYYPRVIFNSNTGKVVIINSDSGDNQRGKCVIGTVSGTSISFGSIVTFTTANTFAQFALFNVGNTNKFIIGLKNGSSGTDAICGTISGTSVTFGTQIELQGGVPNFMDGAWHTASDTGVIVWYNSAGQLQTITIVVSGTTITKGDAVQVTNGNNQQAYPCIEYDPVNEKMMIAWMSEAENTSPERGLMIATGIPVNASGGTQGLFRVQSVKLIEDVKGEYVSSTFDTVNNEMYIIYRGESYQAARLVRAKIISGDIENSSGVLGIGNSFGGYERVAATTPVGFAGSYPMAYFSSMAFDPTGKKVFAGFPYYYKPGETSAKLGAVWASSTQDTNLTSENFLGFSKASYTDGQTATIKIAGAIDTNQVGLSTSKKYYVLPDASLTNTPSLSGQFFNDPEGKYGYISAGIALSTTNLIIKT